MLYGVEAVVHPRPFGGEVPLGLAVPAPVPALVPNPCVWDAWPFCELVGVCLRKSQYPDHPIKETPRNRSIGCHCARCIRIGKNGFKRSATATNIHVQARWPALYTPHAQ